MNLFITSTKLSKITNTIAKRIISIAFVVGMLLITISVKDAFGYSDISNVSDYKFNMSYIYFGNTYEYINAVKRTKNSINEISPNYFELNLNGTLKITSKMDINFVNEMHKNDIVVVPFISNHWDRNLGRAALNNRLQLVNQIVKAVNDFNLDGINVDLENLTEDDRNQYTDFVKLLRENLPSDKTIAVAVAPNPQGISKGWQGSYDYKALSQYCDYLMIMAYDEHYQGGASGPVSSYNFAESSIKYALQYIPSEKAVLGIPFYGRMWKHEDAIGGQGLSLTDVETLIKKYNGKVTFDSLYKSPKAIITINPQDEKLVVMGKKLIWYENEISIKYKLNLVNKYDLKGTGSWSLGQELPNTWDYYDLWLNGHQFLDSQGHWAQKYIIYAANKGLMIGDGKSSFAPNKPLTRAEAAVVFVRSLGLQELSMQNSENGEDITFNDIEGHWAENEIKIAAQHRIVLGRGDDSFGPDAGITREELAVMIDRIYADLPEQKMLSSRGEVAGNGASIDYDLNYIDVNKENCNWSYESIMRMTQIGILTGAPNGYFLPKNYSCRAEMAALLYRVTLPK